PPFYYLLSKAVMRLGETELLLRLPSWLAGTAAIPLIYVLARLGGISRTGVISAVLLALSGLAVAYSRRARPYALATDACLLAAIGVVLVIRNRWVVEQEVERKACGQRVGWVLFTLASAAGFYLHYSFVVEICALEAAIILAWFRTPSFRDSF